MIADKSYGLTALGEVVAFGDPSAVGLLVAAGGYMEDREAAEYGLPKEFKAVKPAENKAVKPADNKAK